MEHLMFDFARQDDIGEVIGLIEKEGTNINAVDEDSYNLLMVSIFRGLKRLSFYLIDRGIVLSYRDRKGQTVLHHLAVFYDDEVFVKCLEKDIDVTVSDIYGNQPLWTAVFNDSGYGKERLKMIELLIQRGADPNHLNNAGRSPLMFAQTAEYDNVILDILKTPPLPLE